MLSAIDSAVEFARHAHTKNKTFSFGTVHPKTHPGSGSFDANKKNWSNTCAFQTKARLCLLPVVFDRPDGHGEAVFGRAS